MVPKWQYYNNHLRSVANVHCTCRMNYSVADIVRSEVQIMYGFDIKSNKQGERACKLNLEPLFVSVFLL
jgi:hypothetical protein